LRLRPPRRNLINTHRAKLEEFAEALLEHEVL